jgi:AcrR family transcriptional regulator
VKNKSDTRQALLDFAGPLFLRQGYLGFSFQHLAESLDMRKPSIHYHFSSKEVLGTDLLREYLRHFIMWRQRLRKLPANEQYPALVDYFKQFLESEGICPCGMASAEYLMLPETMQRVLRNLFKEQIQVLTDVLQAAQADGLLPEGLQAGEQALQLGATLQGALQIARVQSRPELFEQMMTTAWQNLANET